MISECVAATDFYVVRSQEDPTADDCGSYSSRMSTKSDKNMADFDGEESGCDEEEELVRLTGHEIEVCIFVKSFFIPFLK